MKYIFSFILMAALLAGLWAVDLRFGVGVDAAGETISSMEGMRIGNLNEMAGALSLQLESGRKNWTFGLGVDYQLPRQNQQLPDGWSSHIGDHYHVPVYGVIAYKFMSDSKYSPELIAQLGNDFAYYEFRYLDEGERYKYTDGLYYGYGIGINYENFSLTLLHRTNNSNLMYQELEDDVWEKQSEYNLVTRQINISLGYRFELKK